MSALTRFARPALLVGLGLLLLGCGETGQDYANSTLRAMDRGKANGARGDMQVVAAGAQDKVVPQPALEGVVAASAVEVVVAGACTQVVVPRVAVQIRTFRLPG